MANLTVAVTGGTGFIGKVLIERLLSEGYSVRALMRNATASAGFPASVSIFQGNLGSPVDLLRDFVGTADVLFNCAAEINTNDRMMATNVDGTRNLLDAADGKIRRWVQLSTVDVYGTHHDGVITEATPVAPVNIYEESKAQADALVVNGAAKSGFEYVLLRPSKVYGPEMRNRVLFKLFSVVDKGLFFFIGSPGASANYVHVEDVADALVRCGTLSAARNGVYNISDYRTIEDFVAIIASALHKPVSRMRVPEGWARAFAKMTGLIPGNPLTEQRVNAMVKRATYSTARIEADLGYRRRIPMEDGLRDLAKAWSLQKR